MDGVTYSLSKNDQVNSDEYYNKAAIFADEVLKESEALISPIVQSYHYYLNKIDCYQSNAPEETVLELLILGVLMRIYYPRALKLKGIQYKLLTLVSDIRKRNDNLKPVMNYLKGMMSTLFLLPNVEEKEERRVSNIKELKKLILWLEGSGEFSNEVKRLKKWEEYLSTLPSNKSLDILKAVYNFALWFEVRSNEALGEYTSRVDKYLEEIKNKSYWREDIILRKRVRVEYHLNMVGAEIMNRAFRQSFIDTNSKMLLLPICMTSPSKTYCQSKTFGKDFKCQSCSAKCQVNKLTVIGQEDGFKVMVVPHESSISSDSRKYTLFDENTGVIGVACVLNLISGGWLLKDMNIPAQCVLLDYCGCKKHWHHEGISTCINLNKLQEILSEKSNVF